MESTVQIFQPSGILDGTRAHEFRQEVAMMTEKGAKKILIDFQDVTFMDSSGLGALVLSLKTARSANVDLYLCSINGPIQMLFELTSMDKVFTIFSDRQTAEAELSK